MCIRPDGEFIAPFDIAAVKIVTELRCSEVHPLFRVPAVDSLGSVDHGVQLYYPRGEWVVSPSGPGIHCYHPSLSFTLLPNRRGDAYPLIRLMIPRGARVFWERRVVPEHPDVIILAASEVLVVT